MTTSRVLARNTLFNTVGQVIPMFAAVVAIPILVRHLGTERFGVLTLAWAIIGYFTLFDLGLSRALTHAVATELALDDGERNLAEVAWSSLWLMLALGLVAGSVLALLTPWIVTHGLNVPSALMDESRTTLFLLAASMPLIITNAGFRGLLEAHQDFGAATALRVPLGVFSFVGPLIVLPFSTRLPPIVALLIVGRVLTWLAHLFVCLRRYPYLRARRKIRSATVIPLIRLGGWMTASNIVSPLMNYLDRFLVGAILPMAAVAHYVTPYELITKLSLFPQSLMGVLFPAFASTYARDRERTAALFGRSLRVLLLFMFPLALTAVLFAREGLSAWVGADFARESAPVLRWLAVGVFINSMAHAPFNVLQGTGRPDLTGKLHLVELPLYLAALYTLAQHFGLVGVAMAWVLRITLDAVALMILAARRVPSVSRPIIVIGVWTVAALAVLGAAVPLSGMSTKAAFLVVVVFGFAFVGWTRIVHPLERSSLRRLVGLGPDGLSVYQPAERSYDSGHP